jgi:hypothetical protein
MKERTNAPRVNVVRGFRRVPGVMVVLARTRCKPFRRDLTESSRSAVPGDAVSLQPGERERETHLMTGATSGPLRPLSVWIARVLRAVDGAAGDDRDMVKWRN